MFYRKKIIGAGAALLVLSVGSLAHAGGFGSSKDNARIIMNGIPSYVGLGQSVVIEGVMAVETDSKIGGCFSAHEKKRDGFS